MKEIISDKLTKGEKAPFRKDPVNRGGRDIGQEVKGSTEIPKNKTHEGNTETQLAFQGHFRCTKGREALCRMGRERRGRPST